MAFSTEFVMGAGGSVEEIPVSMSGGGGSSSSPTVYPLTTVDAGAGALITVMGTVVSAATTSSGRPHMQIGSLTNSDPVSVLAGPTGFGVGGLFMGIVQVAVLSRSSLATTFDGTVYVTRM